MYYLTYKLQYCSSDVSKKSATIEIANQKVYVIFERRPNLSCKKQKANISLGCLIMVYILVAKFITDLQSSLLITTHLSFIQHRDLLGVDSRCGRGLRKRVKYDMEVLKRKVCMICIHSWMRFNVDN